MVRNSFWYYIFVKIVKLYIYIYNIYIYIYIYIVDVIYIVEVVTPTDWNSVTRLSWPGSTRLSWPGSTRLSCPGSTRISWPGSIRLSWPDSSRSDTRRRIGQRKTIRRPGSRGRTLEGSVEWRSTTLVVFVKLKHFRQDVWTAETIYADLSGRSTSSQPDVL